MKAGVNLLVDKLKSMKEDFEGIYNLIYNSKKWRKKNVPIYFLALSLL